MNSVIAALLAPRCATCDQLLDCPLAGAVCPACWAAVVPCNGAFTLTGIAQAQALGVYDGTLREIIHALKYDARRSAAPPLARLMEAHAGGILAGADAVVPVPLHWRRLRQRGFNQAEDLARRLGVPVLRALTRARSTRPQVELAADARHRNVAGAFAITRRADLGGLVLVVVDDVTTTGATLEACARVLIGAGAAEVRALTAARVVT